MEITELIKHPEQLDRDTLYELRSMLALYPYFQTARLLMLQNLYLLHDPSFDEELRRAAIYITDRNIIFQLVEAAHYKLKPNQQKSPEKKNPTAGNDNRTISLIDSFLDTIPHNNGEEKKKRKPTPADAAVDYVAYLMESESNQEEEEEKTPQLKGHSLIDSFIENDKGKIILNETPEYIPQISDQGNKDEKDNDEGIFTETLARIYIKQGRYSKALEIIKRLSLNYPKKNAYFADQIRFLEKLIINSNKQK
ncbi:tetratricopeptide repeat protein [Xylanibacter muris]|uniref:Tetratricopeptide repeat protein n=1 Tax=Xylanibacter muris TaxID=2736290 RepID=A0ABX2AJ86_9BACT|nr:tetratricopeptide repeat protein [Xylanibacter muris]NPD91186.1 tetratricopeptide repeat protein [Xylanibacter muris]